MRRGETIQIHSGARVALGRPDPKHLTSYLALSRMPATQPAAARSRQEISLKHARRGSAPVAPAAAAEVAPHHAGGGAQRRRRLARPSPSAASREASSSAASTRSPGLSAGASGTARAGVG
jgi:hypothetical protein